MDNEPEYVEEEYDFDYWRTRSERIFAIQEARNIEAAAEAAYNAMYAESPETIGGEDVHVKSGDPHKGHTGGSFIDWLF